MACVCLILLKPWAPGRSEQRLWFAYLYPFSVFPFLFFLTNRTPNVPSLKTTISQLPLKPRDQWDWRECHWVQGKLFKRAISALRGTISVLALTSRCLRNEHDGHPSERAWGWKPCVRGSQTKRWKQPGLLKAAGPRHSPGLPTYGLLLREPKSKPLSHVNSSYLSLCNNLIHSHTEAF